MTLKAIEVKQMVACDYTLFPFKFHEIINSLEKIGFEISPQIPSPLPYGRFTGSGQVGRKGKIYCVINSFNNSFLMVGETVENTSDELNEFIITLLDSYNIDIYEKLKWLEFQAQYEYRTKKDPTMKINNKFSAPIVNDISEILGIEIKPITSRMGLSGNYPNQIEWFDISMKPDFQKNDRYEIGVILRTADKNKYQI